MKVNRILGSILAASTAIVTTGCSNTTNMAQTKLSLKPATITETMTVGKTKKVDVIKSLGAPNMVFKENAEKEVWTYDQVDVNKSETGYNLGLFLLGSDPTGPASILGGGRVGTESKNSTSSVRTMTIIVEFNKSGLVSDYQMLSTSF